ncbi:hypothetical protein HMN09_01332100 [Mycena chlorophos]|uniref:Uncharacterized protein n=1 Tax=Mycena chlorophos TaxID=658473 RepID=A0A8H6S1P8_MYCCL|nr:hypothetical protein HMN09_01332100 [Mycena chlorophos]
MKSPPLRHASLSSSRSSSAGSNSGSGSTSAGSSPESITSEYLDSPWRWRSVPRHRSVRSTQLKSAMKKSSSSRVAHAAASGSSSTTHYERNEHEHERLRTGSVQSTSTTSTMASSSVWSFEDGSTTSSTGTTESMSSLAESESASGSDEGLSGENLKTPTQASPYTTAAEPSSGQKVSCRSRLRHKLSTTFSSHTLALSHPPRANASASAPSATVRAVRRVELLFHNPWTTAPAGVRVRPFPPPRTGPPRVFPKSESPPREMEALPVCAERLQLRLEPQLGDIDVFRDGNGKDHDGDDENEICFEDDEEDFEDDYEVGSGVRFVLSEEAAAKLDRRDEWTKDEGGCLVDYLLMCR